MSYSLISSTSKGSTDGNTALTDDVDTSGANLLVAVVGDFTGEQPSVISDNKSNSWFNPRARKNAGISGCTVYYAYNPTVGSSHHFQASRNGSFPSIAVLWASGAPSTDPIDSADDAGTTSATSVGTGTINPGLDNELLAFGLCLGVASTPSLSLGAATIIESVLFTGGQHVGVYLANEIQTTALAQNGTWSWSSSGDAAAQSASFIAGTGGGGAVNPSRLAISGVGHHKPFKRDSKRGLWLPNYRS